jgi:branched-chain amino acid transport system permease protein
MNVTTIFILHGLVYAGLLFLVSSGLTLVFGMMNVLNFAHASFYMLAAYFSYSLLTWTGNFWLSLAFCPFFLFVIGAVIERFLLRRVHVLGHVHELLLTFGIAFIISELVKWVWGTAPLPEWQRQPIRCHLPDLSSFRFILLHSHWTLNDRFTSQNSDRHHRSECSG